MATLSLRIDNAAVKRLVGEVTGGAARQAANTAASRAKSNIQAKGRIDSSAMYRGMTVQETSAPALSTAFLVYTPVKYAAFQEFGTRAHGPKRASHMVFKPKGQSAFVFAKWVRGVEPAFFMTNALKSMSTKDFLRMRL